MKKIQLGSIHERIRDRDISLQYYLTEEEKDRGRALYGIEVKLESEGKKEIEWTGAISDCQEKVKEIGERLIRCQVTPYVLLEVVDDLFTQTIAGES